MVLVVSKNNVPLMPTNNHGLMRKYVDEGKAKVISKDPFAVQLLFETSEVTEPLILGIDPGRVNIGYAVINLDGVCLLTGELVTRNKKIPGLMKARQLNRQMRRKHAREKKQRRAIANDTCYEERERILPKCKKPITCKYIDNSEAQFCNRKRPFGWLTPTANQLKQTHLNLIAKLCKYLPITSVVIELNKFSFMAMENPNIQRWQYAKGPLYGTSLKEAISEMQGHKCLLCKAEIEHFHHIVPRSQNGSDTLGNLVGLCECCHKQVHTDEKTKAKLDKKVTGNHKKYGSLSVLNQILPSFLEELATKMPVTVTHGQSTYQLRKDLSLSKTHAVDSYCIALSQLDYENLHDLSPETLVRINMKQYRRHDRQVTHQEMLNRPYKLNNEDKKPICFNRNKACEQKTKCVKDLPKSLIPFLKPQRHEKINKKLDRPLPGSYIKEAGVLHSSKGSPGTPKQYYHLEGGSKIQANKAIISYHNTGLVFQPMY